jgi:hypothetical protein
MYQKQQRVSAGRAVALLTLVSAIAVERGMIANPVWYLVLFITIPVMLAYRFFGHR